MSALLIVLGLLGLVTSTEGDAILAAWGILALGILLRIIETLKGVEHDDF